MEETVCFVKPAASGNLLFALCVLQMVRFDGLCLPSEGCVAKLLGSELQNSIKVWWFDSSLASSDLFILKGRGNLIATSIYGFR